MTDEEVPNEENDGVTTPDSGEPNPSEESETPKSEIREIEVTYLPEGYYISEAAHANVIRTFQFYTEDGSGHLEGFNLDDQISTGDEEESCGVSDKVTEGGILGVDNQLGALWEILEPLVGDAVRALIQNAVNDGRLLIMIELTQVDDLYQDGLIGLNFFRGALNPVVGTTGLIVPDQTFYVDYDSASKTFDNLKIEEGIVNAGPVEFIIPIEIFDANFDLFVKQGRIHFEIQEDGSFVGMLGGVIHVKDVLDQLLNTNARSEAQLVQPIFERHADLGYIDGTCTQISAAFGFSGTTAFVVREEGRTHSVTD